MKKIILILICFLIPFNTFAINWNNLNDFYLYLNWGETFTRVLEDWKDAFMLWCHYNLNSPSWTTIEFYDDTTLKYTIEVPEWNNHEEMGMVFRDIQIIKNTGSAWFWLYCHWFFFEEWTSINFNWDTNEDKENGYINFLLLALFLFLFRKFLLITKNLIF